MPDKRTHRGPHPEDARLFARDAWPVLRGATAELSWLLSRGYADKSSLKLVGDRHRLNERQRVAVLRCACADAALEQRSRTQVRAADVRGRPLLIDGYNVLTTIEAALAGGVLLVGRDGCCRDMASMHGHYRRVQETVPALTLIGDALAALAAGPCTWYLDSPVSNSGRLRGFIVETAADAGWDWRAELSTDPDPVLMEADEIVATADSVILDRCRRWFNLARHMVEAHVPEATVVDLNGPTDAGTS